MNNFGVEFLDKLHGLKAENGELFLAVTDEDGLGTNTSTIKLSRNQLIALFDQLKAKYFLEGRMK